MSYVADNRRPRLDKLTAAGDCPRDPAIQVQRERRHTVKTRYDCSKCPGYCCSYPRIPVKKRDLERLALHFGITKAEAKERFTMGDPDDKKNGKPSRIMRHKDDETFGTICTFFDQDARNCGVYEARPKTCRGYPGLKRCGYYEFLRFERRAQKDPEYIATTGN